uniref:Wdr67 protein n=1 Tax=Fopius arisanus TaxID=64838 RepID=A0A0C9RGN5_9HYME
MGPKMENNSNNLILKETDPGGSYAGEHSGETTGNARSGLVEERKKRVRLSGAARRKLKRLKQQQFSEEIATLAQAASQIEVIRDVEVPGASQTEMIRDVGAQKRGVKRPLPEPTTPSPTTAPRVDKMGTKDQGTSAQTATHSLRLAVKPQSYPNQKLDAEGVT